MATKPSSYSPGAEPWATLQVTFGESVRAQRVEAGWTQSELSKRSGIDQKEISRIENGQLNLTIRTMSRLADTLHVSVGEMLGNRRDTGER